MKLQSLSIPYHTLTVVASNKYGCLMLVTLYYTLTVVESNEYRYLMLVMTIDLSVNNGISHLYGTVQNS